MGRYPLDVVGGHAPPDEVVLVADGPSDRAADGAAVRPSPDRAPRAAPGSSPRGGRCGSRCPTPGAVPRARTTVHTVRTAGPPPGPDRARRGRRDRSTSAGRDARHPFGPVCSHLDRALPSRRPRERPERDHGRGTHRPVLGGTPGDRPVPGDPDRGRAVRRPPPRPERRRHPGPGRAVRRGLADLEAIDRRVRSTRISAPRSTCSRRSARRELDAIEFRIDRFRRSTTWPGRARCWPTWGRCSRPTRPSGPGGTLGRLRALPGVPRRGRGRGPEEAARDRTGRARARGRPDHRPARTPAGAARRGLPGLVAGLAEEDRRPAPS